VSADLGPPVEKERPSDHHDARPNHQQSAHTTDGTHYIGSRQVFWWAVHEFVSPLLSNIGSWPMIGTPEWCNLADDDPAKMAAIYDAAQHWALRVETSQAALAETSQNISAAADWSHISQQIRGRAEVYIPRVAS
jgi:Protein of unknown function (DUF2742)